MIESVAAVLTLNGVTAGPMPDRYLVTVGFLLEAFSFFI